MIPHWIQLKHLQLKIYFVVNTDADISCMAFDAWHRGLSIVGSLLTLFLTFFHFTHDPPDRGQCGITGHKRTRLSTKTSARALSRLRMCLETKGYGHLSDCPVTHQIRLQHGGRFCNALWLLPPWNCTMGSGSHPDIHNFHPPLWKRDEVTIAPPLPSRSPPPERSRSRILLPSRRQTYFPKPSIQQHSFEYYQTP